MFLKAFIILSILFCLATAARITPIAPASEFKRDHFSLESFGHGKHHSHALKTIRSPFGSSNKAVERSFPENGLDSAGPGAPAYGSVGGAGFGSPVGNFNGPTGQTNLGAAVVHPGSFGGQQSAFGGPSAFGVQSASFAGQPGSFGGQYPSFGGQPGSPVGQPGPFGGHPNSFGSHSGLSGGQAGSYGGAQGAAPGYSGAAQGGYGGNSGAGMPYQFQYSVNEYGNNFGHSQLSDGNQVSGRYYVQLPDGRLQTVDFKADPLNGYTADVQYQGQAQYPSNEGSYALGLGNGGGIGGGSVGQLPLAFHDQGNHGSGLPGSSGSYTDSGAFSAKPY
ncbi:pro-resilin-like [Daphnia carinata]|uniref:pro-resilin-like n=1 Tax=Daphnia carinata TaxID=120202 RepID=UPI00258041B0|nr:pro-resilin-like [Daphnia carinata]